MSNMSNIYKDLSQVLTTQLDVSEGTCYFLQLRCCFTWRCIKTCCFVL